jgi:hypothetical protein
MARPAEVPPRRNSLRVFVLPVASLAAVAVVVFGIIRFLERKPGQRSIAQEKAENTVRPPANAEPAPVRPPDNVEPEVIRVFDTLDVLKEFVNNGLAAEVKYKDKLIEIRVCGLSEIRGSGDAIRAIASLPVPDYGEDVECTFTPACREVLIQYRRPPDDLLIVRGVFDRISPGGQLGRRTVWLRDCVFVPDRSRREDAVPADFFGILDAYKRDHMSAEREFRYQWMTTRIKPIGPEDKSWRLMRATTPEGVALSCRFSLSESAVVAKVRAGGAPFLIRGRFASVRGRGSRDRITGGVSGPGVHASLDYCEFID